MTEDNTALMEEMLRNAKAAPEPGDLKKGQLIPDGNKQLPGGVIELKSAGYVRIYDTLTGEESIVNRNMLPDKLKQTRPDGSFVFSTKQSTKPARGTFKCLLHKDNPNRKHYDELGLSVCRKDNLTAPHQVKLHMMHRHKTEWETIENERIEMERQEDRSLQKAILTAAGGIAPKSIAKPIEKAEKANSVEDTPPVEKGTCPYCGKTGIDGRHTRSCSKRPE
jgi:hypothetical protein